MPGNVCYVPELHGFQEVIVVPDPAAATDWTYAVPAGSEFYIDSVMFLFVADANVFGRTLRMSLTTPAAAFLVRWWFTTPIVATETVTVSLWIGNPRPDNRTYFNYSDALPAMRLPAGSNIATGILNMQVGDQISDIRLNVKRFRVV